MRLGLLGLGRIGAFHAETLAGLPAVEELVLSDPVPALAEQVAGRLGARIAGSPGTCGRRLESAWSNGKPAYRCRHGYTSATGSSPGRPKNLYVREDQILPRLAALAILHADGSHSPQGGEQASAQVTAPAQVPVLRTEAGQTVIEALDPQTMGRGRRGAVAPARR